MEQFGNSVNRTSGAHLIGDQNHMGEIIERLQSGQQANSQADQSQPRTLQQQQGSGDRHVSRQNDNRTRQAY